MCYYSHRTPPCCLDLVNVIPWVIQDPISQTYFKSIAYGSKGSSVRFPVFAPPQFICSFHSFLIQSSAVNHHQLQREEQNLDAHSPSVQL